MRAFLILVLSVMLPVILGVVGYQIGSTFGFDTTTYIISMGAFVLGSIPAMLLWRRAPKTGYPDSDVGDAGFWVSGDSGSSSDPSHDWDSGSDVGGDGGGDGGGGGD